MNTGAFAERVVVCPSQCVRIPRDMPFASASLLSCGVITGVGAVINTAGVAPGATVAVIGAGGVGLNAIQGAAIAGASTILALDLLEAKLADARDFGATHGLLASDNDVLSKALALTTNGRGFDYVFVTVGAPKAFEETPRFLARGGAMVVVGMPPADAVLGYSPLLLADRSIRFLGSSMGQTNVGRDIPWLTSLYQQGRLKLDELVSATYRLEEINEAFEATRAGRIRRNVILFD
jgi:Zn-dependent alcohol dehydrogenase